MLRMLMSIGFHLRLNFYRSSVKCLGFGIASELPEAVGDIKGDLKVRGRYPQRPLVHLNRAVEPLRLDEVLGVMMKRFRGVWSDSQRARKPRLC